MRPFRAHLTFYVREPLNIAQNLLEIRQDSCAVFAQSDEKFGGVICTSDLIRGSLILRGLRLNQIFTPQGVIEFYQ